MLKFRPSK